MPAQATKSKQAAAPEVNRSVVLTGGRFGLKEHRVNVWSCTAPEGSVPDDVLKQEFWSLTSEKLRPYDEIDVISNDASWMIKVKVLSCSNTWAHVHEMHRYQFETATSPSKSTRFRVMFRGPEEKWCVIRNSDDMVVMAKLETMQIANQVMADHEGRK